MGITYINGKVSGPSGEAIAKFLVDSGARYTLLPNATWKKIGLQPKRSMRFVLADGTEVERNISECLIKLPPGEGHTPVILGKEKRRSITRSGDARRTGTRLQSIRALVATGANDAYVGAVKSWRQ